MNGKVSHRLCFEKQMRETGGKYGGVKVVAGGKLNAQAEPEPVKPTEATKVAEPEKAAESAKPAAKVPEKAQPEVKAEAVKQAPPPPPKSPASGGMQLGGGNKCATCTKTVYPNEQVAFEGKVYHSNGCFACSICKEKIQSTSKAGSMDGRVSHRLCFEKQMRETGGKYGGVKVVAGGKGNVEAAKPAVEIDTNSEKVMQILSMRARCPDNLAIQCFDDRYYATLTPELQTRFLKCLDSGRENADSSMGCYANHPDDYEVFRPFFRTALSRYYKVNLDEKKHVNNWDYEGDYDLTKLGLGPTSMRVRTARNLKRFPLPGSMTKDDRLNMEKAMQKVFDKLIADPNFGGRYVSITPGHPNFIDQQEYQQLVDGHIMFKDMANDPYLNSAGISRDWPFGRGCYISADSGFIIWVGEEDHLRIMAMKVGVMLNDVFDRLKAAIGVVEALIEGGCAYSPEFGVVTSCPTNVGTGMRASVLIQLPNLTVNGEGKAKEVARPLGLSVRGMGGEHTAIGKDGTVDISPSARFCISEAEIVKALYLGLGKLKQAEMAAGEAKTDVPAETKSTESKAGSKGRRGKQAKDENAINPRSRQFLGNVAGFLESKRAVDATALAVLPHRWMEAHPNFMDADAMRQRNMRKELVTNLDEVMEVAAVAKPVFDKIVRRLVEACGLNPDEEVIFDDREVMLEHHVKFQVLTLAPLKSVVRCQEKAMNEYDGDFSRLVDLVRCSIVLFTEEQLAFVAKALAKTDADSNSDLVVVRFKNRFKYPLFNGYRDALYSVAIDCGNGIKHVCEVQVHLAAIVAHKMKSHVFYEYFRSYFAGSGAESQRMDALAKMAVFGTDVDAMIAQVVEGSNLDHLTAFLQLVGKDGLGDVNLTILARKRIMELQPNDFSNNVQLANCYMKLGKFVQAEQIFQALYAERKEETNDPDAVGLITSLGWVLYKQSKYKESEPLLRDGLAARSALLGDEHPDTLTSMANLAVLLNARGSKKEAEQLYRDSLAGRRKVLGDTHIDTLSSVANLASFLRTQNQLDEAEPLMREVLATRRQKFGLNHSDTLQAINGLGLLLKAQGKKQDALPLFREAMEGRKEVMGADHPETLSSLTSLALLLKSMGDKKESEGLLREALAGRRSRLGDEHKDTLSSMCYLASCLNSLGQREEAEKLYFEALNGRRKLLGNTHADTLDAALSLSACLTAQGKAISAGVGDWTSVEDVASALKNADRGADAEALFRDLLTARRQQFGDAHEVTLKTLGDLAWALRSQRKLPESEALYLELVTTQQNVLGSEHPETLSSVRNLEALQMEKNESKSADESRGAEPDQLPFAGSESVEKLAELEGQIRETLATRRQQLGDVHAETLHAINDLAINLKQQGKFAEAEPLYAEILNARRSALGPESAETLNSLNNLAIVLKSQNKFAEAEELYREGAAVRRKVLGDSHPDTMHALANLGLMLSSQGKPAENELRTVLVLCREHLGPEHPDTREAAERLGLLLHDLGNLDEAKSLLQEVVELWRNVLSKEQSRGILPSAPQGKLREAEKGLFHALCNYGKLFKDQESLQEAFEGQSRVLGPEHPTTLQTKALVDSLQV